MGLHASVIAQQRKPAQSPKQSSGPAEVQETSGAGDRRQTPPPRSALCSASRPPCSRPGRGGPGRGQMKRRLERQETHAGYKGKEGTGPPATHWPFYWWVSWKAPEREGPFKMADDDNVSEASLRRRHKGRKRPLTRDGRDHHEQSDLKE
ncbi:hypothetical protein NDU88_008646 [Pleurodeles waltl]|uniref:Uncharacterized protein n=1 Tax=Pleurodeles waltl TaxID=8319 RepID=A0AAV7NX56_PLEWA|nr:hypothetical protein NDU88_008646 [Pleurodeles waltl]